jgi:hypothetical protein
MIRCLYPTPQYCTLHLASNEKKKKKQFSVLRPIRSKGRFTPRGRANSLGKRLKFSLVIGQKAHIGPNNSFTPRGRADLVVYIFFNYKMYIMTRPELVELGAPKMEGQCHISLKKPSYIKYDFFYQTRSVGLCGNLNGSMLDYAKSVGLC